MQMEMGGSERLVHTLVNSIDRSVFNPFVAWFFGDAPLKEFTDLHVPLFHVPKKKRIDVSAMKKLSDIVRENNIHVVNAHHFMSFIYAFYGCKIANRRRLIYTEHSEWEIDEMTERWKIIGSFLLKRSDASVGVTPAVSLRIQSAFKTSEAKTFAIENGVDISRFSRSLDKAKMHASLGLREEEKVIGIVANFKKIKNHMYLLKAFNELIKEYEKVRLLLVGQGFKNDPENTETEIRGFIEKNGLDDKVTILGYRSDVPDLLSIMDIFCLTSFSEGLPISLIEAMAAGLPLVGTDVKGIKEVIIQNRNGILVNVNEVDEMKRALLALLGDESLRKRMGKESRYLVEKHYSVNGLVRQYENLFKSLMQ
jgi:glycosyltransferase involved in cell wall biosynthesis